jgi:hypothetical protein
MPVRAGGAVDGRGGLGTFMHNPSQRVDGCISDAGAGVGGQQLDRGRHEELNARTAHSRFAAITGQGMQGAGHDGRIVVGQPGQHIGDGVVVEQLVEDNQALTTDSRIGVGQTSSQGRYCWRARQPEVPMGGPGAVIDRQMLDEGVKVMGLRVEHDHRAPSVESLAALCRRIVGTVR